jgi:hypothetical protein
MRAQERAPRLSVALRRRRQPSLGEECSGPRWPRRRCRGCAARRRSAGSPNWGSRARAAGSARAPHGRLAAVRDGGADRSSGGRPAADASAAASPAEPRTTSSCVAAGPGSAPPAAAGRAARIAADGPAGGGSTARAGARESRTPSPAHAERGARPAPATDTRRRTAAIQAKAPPADGDADATRGINSPTAVTRTGFLHPTG